jgi:hypothetical protein
MPREDVRDAILEAYASVKNELTVLYGLEIEHPSFEEPIRVIRWAYETPELKYFKCRHEDDAPIGPGMVFDYMGAPFELTRPESSQNTDGTFELRMAATNDVDKYLYDAAMNPGIITATFRSYIMGRELDGPGEVWRDIRITTPRREGAEVKVDGAVLGWLSKPFGSLYTPIDYPGLATKR